MKGQPANEHFELMFATAFRIEIFFVLSGDDEGEESSGSGGPVQRSVSGGGDANPVPTPPDSPLMAAAFDRPRALSNGQIDPQIDLYAIPSVEGNRSEWKEDLGTWPHRLFRVASDSVFRVRGYELLDRRPVHTAGCTPSSRVC